MDNLPLFMKYAADFEKTLADDDWTRLRQYFAADAVYEVKSDGFPCKLTGPDAIFKGIKKSLDGFDRKYLETIQQYFSAWSVSYNKWTSVLERLAGELPETAWDEKETEEGESSEYTWIFFCRWKV